MTSDPDATIVVSGATDHPQLPGYEIERLLGEGGMARVYLARDVNLNRPVAIKFMSAALAENQDFRERFDEEGKIIARFRHPNIVTVHASGSIHASRYIVQEYVSGGTLEDRIQQRNVQPRDAFRIAREMAGALAYSHERQIVHRDLKPANILFTEDGAAVLSDFGIARSIAEDDGRTVAGSVIGSLRYMAPEQLRGERPTDRVDVYALGIVMFEMLTGDVPPNDLKVIATDAQRAALRSRLPEDARGATDFIAACLHPSASERPSAEECLRLLLDQRNALLRRRQRSATLRTAAAVLVVLALGLATIVSWWRSIPVLQVQPPTAAVYLDGAPHEGRLPLDGDASLAISVLHNGYYGVSQTVTQPAADDVQVVLQPWRYPQRKDFIDFNSLFSVDTPAASIDPQQFDDPLFRGLLTLLRTHAQGERNALQAQQDSLLGLARLGDAPAQLGLVLAADEGLISMDSAEQEEMLRRASQAGYALATFYLALHNRQKEETIRGGTDRLAISQYAQTMERAVQQGLSFAADYAAQARQALAD